MQSHFISIVFIKLISYLLCNLKQITNEPRFLTSKLQLWVKGLKYESIIKSSVPINLKEISIFYCHFFQFLQVDTIYRKDIQLAQSYLIFPLYIIFVGSSSHYDSSIPQLSADLHSSLPFFFFFLILSRQIYSI